jgi:type IV pilus assembly protein PilA
MLILGILAAIALPAFFNQKDKAGDAKAKEYAHSAQVAMETFATDHDGAYDGATPAELIAIEPTLSSATFTNLEGAAFKPAPEGKTYTIAVAGSTGQEFEIENNSGTLAFKCKTAGTGGCPSPAVEGWGNWGG